MSQVVIEQHAEGLRVRVGAWIIEHSQKHGGAWTSLVNENGSGRNLLTQPLTSRIRFHELSDGDDYGSYPTFSEAMDSAAHLRVEISAEGHSQVVAEGVYKNAAGDSLPVGFRRRTEYRDFGLIWTTLEILSESGCDGVVHVRALEANLRPGLTDLYSRAHPIVLNSSDQTGMGAFSALPKKGQVTAFSSRYTPLQLMCFERGVEGIEFFPGSELAQWDCSLKPDAGLGLYQVHHSEAGTTLELDPFCMAFRRERIRLQGAVRFKLGIALPEIKPRRRVHTGPFHASTGSRWASDADLAGLAKAGIKWIRFHNDYRKDGPFWHDGMYPPYDAAGMAELRRIIDTSHRLGMKIVPYISLKEFHPESQGYAENHRDWMHMAAPSVGVIHTYIRGGEFGGLMCLRSGWLAFRKQSIEQILSDLPWDGLYFDWCVPHPCCHPGHGRGPWHYDVDEFLDFMLFCRRRVGEQGIIFSHISGLPSIVVENMSDLVFIHEDLGGFAPLPGQFPAQCSFMPIAPRQLAVHAPAGSDRALRFITGGILEGYPPAASAPAREFGRQALQEMALFAGVNLPAMTFYPAREKAVKTGQKAVYAAAWAGEGELVLYAGNLGAKKCAGKLRFGGLKSHFDAQARFAVEMRAGGKRKKLPVLKGSALKQAGLKYSLAAGDSCVYVLKTL